MNEEIWFNIQRLYYSLKGIVFRGSIKISGTRTGFKKGDLVKVDGISNFNFQDGFYKISRVYYNE